MTTVYGKREYSKGVYNVLLLDPEGYVHLIMAQAVESRYRYRYRYRYLLFVQ